MASVKVFATPAFRVRKYQRPLGRSLANFHLKWGLVTLVRVLSESRQMRRKMEGVE